MKQELLTEFETSFENIKKELGFKATLAELDAAFFFKDVIAREGYVPPGLSRMLCHRMCDTLMSWANYLQGLLVPNPSSMVSCTESQMFDEKEKEHMMLLLNKILALVSKNAHIGITRNKKAEGEFIDASLLFWNTTLVPELGKMTQKINEQWIERTNAS